MWYLENYNPLLAGSIDGTDTVPHDHGIVRALNSYYSINNPVISKLTSNLLKTLFVGRLNENTNENDIKKVFSKFGKISNVRVVVDIVTGISRGYGFIEFDSEKDCKRAYNNGDNITIDGHKVLIDYERARVMKNWIPRRLGGGFGGKKESGQLRFGSIDRPFKEPLNIGENQKMPDIRRNQKYSDCWRDYIYKKEENIKEILKKNDKDKIDKNKNEDYRSKHSSESKDHYSHNRHLIDDKYYTNSKNRDRHSSNEKNHKRSNDRYTSKDRSHSKSHSRSRSRHSNKRHRENKYDNNETTKKKRIDDNNENKQSKKSSSSSKYEKSSKSESRHTHHHHHRSHDKRH